MVNYNFIFYVSFANEVAVWLKFTLQKHHYVV